LTQEPAEPSSGRATAGLAEVVSRFSPGVRYNARGYFAERIQTPGQFEQHCSDQPPAQQIGPIVLPRGIMIRGDFLGTRTRTMLTDFADRQEGRESTVQDLEEMAARATRLETTQRSSKHIDIRGIAAQVLPVIESAYREAEKFYGLQVEWFEFPEMLRYAKGGHYVPHADAENWDPGTGRWLRGLDRDLSVIIYLNDQFKGGQLDFPNFGFRVQPRAGLLACFPADHRYVHTARPVESGVRYILVSWAAVRGSVRVHRQRPVTAVPMSVGMP
jgi:predicted 2-oxoglutarate/Fe(II)-dependent dioxygenase YbiX